MVNGVIRACLYFGVDLHIWPIRNHGFGSGLNSGLGSYFEIEHSKQTYVK